MRWQQPKSGLVGEQSCFSMVQNNCCKCECACNQALFLWRFFWVSCRWYHGTLSRAEAETLLTLCKESSYLVRNSQTCRNDYSLSLRYSLLNSNEKNPFICRQEQMQGTLNSMMKNNAEINLIQPILNKCYCSTVIDRRPVQTDIHALITAALLSHLFFLP